MLAIRRFITNNRLTVASLKFCSKYKFCDQHKQLQAINIQMLDHSHYLADTQRFASYFDDSRLLELVRTNYYLSDLVRIANILMYHIKKEQFTDAKVLFMVYTFNLYFMEMKAASSSIYTITTSALQQRIKNRNFVFSPTQIEKIYLSNLNYLTRRQNSYLIRQRGNLQQHLFNFVCLKYKIMSREAVYSDSDQLSLQRLIQALAYLPKDSSKRLFLNGLQQHLLQIIVVHTNNFLRKSNCDQLQDTKIVIKRFILIKKAAIQISRLADKYINIFPVLPTQFEEQKLFIRYLKILQNLVAQHSLNVFNMGQLKQYHFLLADKNKKYRSAAALKAMEDYVQHLIAAKHRDHIVVFSPFFDQNPFVYDRTKWKSKSQKQKFKAPSNLTEQQ